MKDYIRTVTQQKKLVQKYSFCLSSFCAEWCVIFGVII